MKSLLSLGECMVELAPVQSGLLQRGFAGDTLNTAWYARRLLPADWRVSFGSCIGQDAISDEMADFLAAQGIDTSALRRDPERTVGLYMISLQNGERSFSYWRGQSAAKQLAADPDWLAQTLAGRDMIHFSAITLAILSAEGRETLCSAIAQARNAGALVSFDTNLRPRLWESREAMQAGVMRGASVADIVLPSFDEEVSLWHDRDHSQTLARYHRAGAGLVVVKDGGSAITLSSAQGQRQLSPAPVAQLVDTTAAGDSFAGGLLAGLAIGLGEDEAARRAITLSGQVIQSRGALVSSIFD